MTPTAAETWWTANNTDRHAEQVAALEALFTALES